MFTEYDYNVRKRVFKNGLCEIRFFKKSVRCGHVESRKEHVKMYEIEDIPFEEKKVRISKFHDDDGFSITCDSDSDRSVRISMKRTIDKIYDYANCNEWQWFCTFTFDKEKVVRDDYDDVVAKFSQWLRNMKKKYCKEMKYLVVPEKHKDGSYHFHGLFSNCDGLDFVPAQNLQETYKGKKNKYYMQPLVRKGQQVYDIKRFKMGYTDCTKVIDTKKVANYILKYITKELIKDTPSRKRYWRSKNLDLPQEESFLVPVLNYDDMLQDMLSELVKNGVEVYTNSCDLAYGDFENKITYIKFDMLQGNLDIDKKYSVFGDCVLGPNAIDKNSSKNPIDIFLEKNKGKS